MGKKIQVAGLTFAEACEYLALSPDDLASLREAGLVACIREQGKQIYPREALGITQRFLNLRTKQRWSQGTLAWFADLCFAASVGRSVWLPIDMPTTKQLSSSWLERPNIQEVLGDFESVLDGADESFANLLRSIVTVGEGRLWEDTDNLGRSDLFPLVQHLENTGISIIGQSESIARDTSLILTAVVLTFTHIAPPISKELSHLIESLQPNLTGNPYLPETVTPHDQSIIQNEGLVAIDKIYASKATEIHTPAEVWNVKMGLITAQKRSIALQLKLPLESDAAQIIIDNIIDLVRPYVGPYGARVIQLLYEIANDPPYWRNPLITVDTNDVLDRLGLKRDSRGFHYSRNRERLRDVLNIAHNLEIVWEFTVWEKGEQARKTFYRTVLSLMGATFDPKESQGLSTLDLREHGLPKAIQLRLNFYDGVRRPDGRLGNQYVLMTRIAEPEKLMSAKFSGTHERLKAFLLFRYRQMQMTSRTIGITRQTALEKSNIKTKHITRATQILTKALEKLIADGTLDEFTAVPLKDRESFTITLSSKAVLTISSSDTSA